MRDKHIVDTRIHCCLYFIRPSGHSLKPIDIIVMKKLSDVVNVVPVIAKADTLTLEERTKFKETIRSEMLYHNIRSYPFDGDDLDPEETQLNDIIRVSGGPTSITTYRAANKIFLYLLFNFTDYDSLRRRWVREKRSSGRQARQRQKEQVGRHQRRE